MTQSCSCRNMLDLSELSLPSTMKTLFPDPDNLLNFILTIEPDEGMYKGGAFNFTFTINQNFPHDPPKVKCTQKIYHPNIDLEGNVCLNILREVRDKSRGLSDRRLLTRLNAGLEASAQPQCSHCRSAISLPGTESERSPQQGGCGGPQDEQRGIQAEREIFDGWWSTQGKSV